MKIGFALVLLCCFFFQFSSGNDWTDQQRLERFYQSMDGPHWKQKKNWMDEKVDVCDWYGVQCNSHGTGKVIELYLPENHLVGYLDPDVFSGWALEYLYLGEGDEILGEIIPEIFQPSLLGLGIGGPGLTGMNFGEKYNATSLRGLNIRDARIPQIPSEIFTSSLTHLDWSRTRTTQSSTIPTEIGNCIKCNTINIISNGITGPIPTEIGKLQGLQSLLLSDNDLSGTIPSEIGKLANLVSLRLDGNKFFGSLPTELGNLDLYEIDVHDNYLNCSVEDLHLDLSYAGEGDFSDNHITGTLPTNVATTMTHLNLNNNYLTGTLPTVIGKRLYSLLLAHNSLSGTLPSQMGSNLPSLNYLKLQNNYFEGTIPSELQNIKYLSELDLSNNRFEGTIPVEILKINSASWNLSSNFLTGELKYPPQSSLDLSYNSLSGSIPRGSSESYTLNLAHNFFNDTLDVFFTRSYAQLQNLNINSNLFYGTIPSELTRSSIQKIIDFGNNFLTGTIPPLPPAGVDFMNFSHNSLSGLFPSDLPPFKSFDASFNLLSGSLPPQIFVHNEIYVNNNNMIGDIPQWLCDGENFNVTNNNFSCPVPYCCTPDICDMCP